MAAPRTWSTDQIAAIAAAWIRGDTVRAVAADFGTTAQTILRLRVVHCWPARTRGWPVGRPLTAAHRAKIRDTLTGRHFSPAHRAAIATGRARHAEVSAA